jgi:precorrin-8X/cobalt-precorrin-8 methylmutase
MRPEEIEQASMSIIERELAALGHEFDPAVMPVVTRIIHATADFDFADALAFSPGAIEAGMRALKRGAAVVTDTQMAAAGINKKTVAQYGGAVLCYMSDEDVAREAGERGLTRAVVSMERAALHAPEAIFAIGNAPTALLRVCELAAQGKIDPALVIGAPVGFVNVVESKEAVMKTASFPWIVARGRKGGSPVAAAIVNALLYELKNDND